MIRPSDDNEFYELDDPTVMPKASGFLWNDRMMVQATCRGYVSAQFMQPEPAKYSHGPNLEAKSFMQPEQGYYSHHPGRFVYVKDEAGGQVFSAPYEPVRLADSFRFSVGKSSLRWMTEKDGIRVDLTLTLSQSDAVELWRVKVTNRGPRPKVLSLYPYFTVGYMSWMNQSGEYRPDLEAIVCSSVTPYQKYPDYFKNLDLKDKTFLLADRAPAAWEVNQEAFEGEGGLTSPSAVYQPFLSKGDARYETPVCVLQYRVELAPREDQEFRFLFGAAQSDDEIADYKQRYFAPGGLDGFDRAEADYRDSIAEGKGCLTIKTPDPALDNFVNHWLPRQMDYHGKTNRLSTDPQTRNYLQDNMGMSYIRPSTARAAFLLAAGQQHETGEMPDGIILHEGAELKYINQVPHTDHCVWLPLCLAPYLDETDDYAILEEIVPFSGGQSSATLADHVDRGLDWLVKNSDHRGLNYINQGDWCDPMNMVGYKGKGVSGWLTIATAYALLVWADICEKAGKPEKAQECRDQAQKTNEAVNRHLWDGNWYARGITDDNVVFGVSSDDEGRIFLNPQGWALLSGTADSEKRGKLIQAVTDLLESPYGVEKLAPAYTKMREDVGRVTQKHPGSAENGAVYNHAAAFYIYALYSVRENDNAYRLLRKMLPGPDKADMIQRGQLPVFIPNYYRGAFRQLPRTAGRSSHLFNTGTVPWVYRSLIDGLFGVRGCREGLAVAPQLPDHWPEATVTRTFRGSRFSIHIRRESGVNTTQVRVDGLLVDDGVIRKIVAGKEYRVEVRIPSAALP